MWATPKRSIGLYASDGEDVDDTSADTGGVGIGLENLPLRGLRYHWRRLVGPRRTPDEHAMLLTQLLDSRASTSRAR